MRVEAGELDFPSTQGEFQSPFLSEEAYGSARFNALLGQDSAGVIASLGAEAWQAALTRTTKEILTSADTGGMPVNIINDIWWDKEGRNGKLILQGLFATAVFPNSTSKNKMLNAAAEVGLKIAVNTLSAIPIAGPVFDAVIKVAQVFYKLFRRPHEEIVRTVPWQEYSRGLDEEIINKIVVKKITPSVDWTRFFSPPMPAGPFRIRTAGDSDDGKFAVGVFTSGYQPDYTGGLGYMPGTQRMVEVVQCARTFQTAHDFRDAITNVGEYFPATAQWGTVAWGMVERDGPDLYKVQASRLIEDWSDYWGAYFDDLLDLEVGLGPVVSNMGPGADPRDLDVLFLAKAICKFLTFRSGSSVQFFSGDLLTIAPNLNYFIDRNLFSKSKNKLNELYPGQKQFLRPDESLTTPALKRLRERQLAALSSSLVCAYVRPYQVGSRPPFAAFLDPGPPTKSGPWNTFGEQLKAECHRVRQILLDHDARWDVADEDVEDVDPVYAKKLRDSKGVQPPLGFAIAPLDPDAPKPPPPEKPNGGVPFGEFAARTAGAQPGEWSTLKKVLVGAAIAGAGYYGYKKYKGEPVRLDLGRIKDRFRK